MKFSFFSSRKFPVICLGILILAFCSGCKKDINVTENAVEPLSLKSATVARSEIRNFMVITKSETLTNDLEISLMKFGTIVKTIPQIGIVVVQTTDPNFEKKVTLETPAS